MPYKTDLIAIKDPFLDRRTKLIPCKKERIFAMYHNEGFTMRHLSRIFNVSRRLIKFVCYPDTLEEEKARFAIRQKDGRYYDRETHNAAMKDHRRYKHEILKEV